MRILALGLAALAGLVLSGCGYNKMQLQDEQIKAAWAEVLNQYQRRSDLIPNLVSTVKGEANFEQTTLTNVIDARAKATSIQVDPSNLTPDKIQQFQQAQGQLSTALGRLLAVSENYPNLQTNQAFQGLQAQLEGTENRIKVARNDFNGAVADYNVKVRSFPMNILSGMFGFRPKEGFTADPGSDKVPQVKF